MIQYTTLKQQLHNDCKGMKKHSLSYSFMRITSIILFLVFLWLAQRERILYGVAFLFLILFLILVYVHEKLKNQLLFKETELETIEKIEARYQDDWKREERLKDLEEDVILNDLDVVGTNSLLDYIGMSGTPMGKEYLLSIFKDTSSYEDIMKRQQAIQELLNHPNILLELQTYSALFKKHSKKIKKGTMDELIEHAKQKIKLSSISISLGTVMVLITLILCILACIPATSWAFHYVFIAISINIIIVLLQFTKNNVLLMEISSVKDVLEDYQGIMKHFDQVSFTDTYLLCLQKENKKGLKGIRELLNISQMTRLRANLITNLIFNGIFQVDTFTIYKLAKWKEKYGTYMQEWFMNIAQMEALTSISVIGQTKEVYCFPTILKQELPVMKYTDVYHPLIAETRAISNCMEIQNNTYIITGSNMSGKTTFLRTLGINSKLALLGAPVCAKNCQLSLFDIYTSMRIKDDVNEGISTFYAELLSIKTMMDASKLKQPMLVLIDEIFKGTNSADRIICAKEAICRLHLPWVITLVSTHDFELCALEQESTIEAMNYHFEEYYEQNEICFDYQLKNGKCTTTNAKELMRMAGF